MIKASKKKDVFSTKNDNPKDFLLINEDPIVFNAINDKGKQEK